MNMNRKETLFFLMIFLAMLFWAGSWVSGRLLSVQADPFIIIFWRFLFSFIAFLPLMVKKVPSMRAFDRLTVLSIFCASLMLFIYNYLFLKGLSASLAGKGGVIVTTTNPIFAFLLSSAVYKFKISKSQMFALFIGGAGGFILMEPWTWQRGVLLDRSNLVFLMAAFCWACVTLFSQKAQKKAHPFLFNGLIYLIASILAFTILPENWQEISTSGELSFWFNILYLAFVAGAAGAGMYFYAAKKIGAAKASTSTFIVPVLALLLSWFFLGEQPQWHTALGGALAVLSVLVINGKVRIRLFQTSD